MERFAGIALALFGMFCLLLPTTRRDRWLSALPAIVAGGVLHWQSERDRQEQAQRQADQPLDLEAGDVLDPTRNKPGRT
ncbi:hypothetical protein [Synechococcus elongatus]|uniref:Uncharacterized protein n=2 Tax=Synechococcus elongatus TaxID=32046 RepID=A0AAN1QNK3_SYNEL|nr:hypothetical protein [Synechococcus elongatus]QFZ92655.1 hypothetical protein EKO22_10180 [Synechococcus elongatus PCC 11802]